MAKYTHAYRCNRCDTPVTIVCEHNEPSAVKGDPVSKLLDDIEDARDDVKRHTTELRAVWSGGVFSAVLVIGGWITGIVTGYVHIAAFWLCFGLIFGGLVLAIASGVGVVAITGEKTKTRQALRAAERRYRDFLTIEEA